MTDPVSFTSTSPRHSFPFLFAGQSQKEFYVNESLARLDTLLHPSVQDELASPPTGPVDGQCWLVAAGADLEWAGKDGEIASWSAGGWRFVSPTEGMMLRNLTTGLILQYRSGWQGVAKPVLPVGGATVDVEARAALEALVNALEQFGIFL